MSAVVSIYVAPDNPAVMHGDSYEGSLNAWGEEYIDDFNDPDYGMMNYLSASDLSYSVTSGNTGLLTLNGDGTYSFAAPFVEATFSYTIDVSYGGTTEIAYLEIGVLNFAPTTNSLSEMVPHDVPTIVANVDLLGFDIDGEPISLVGPLEADNGDVEIQSNGDILYTPNAGYVGDDEIRFNLTDGITSSEEGTIDITVINMAPFAMQDEGFTWTDPDTGLESWVEYFVLEGNSLTVSAENGLLVNDYDPDPTDQDSLSAFLQIDGLYGSAAVNTDGSFTYTPHQWAFYDPNFAGQTDFFFYYVEDRFGERSGAVVVEVNLAKIVIERTGQNEDSTQPWVGEGVTLAATFIGNISPSGVKYSWSIGDNAIKNYDMGYEVPDSIPSFRNPEDETAYARVIELTADDLDDSSTHFYWINDGQKTASVAVTIMGQNVQKTAQFDVAPPPDFTIIGKTGELQLSPSGDILRFGDSRRYGLNPDPNAVLGFEFITDNQHLDPITGGIIFPPGYWRFARVLNSSEFYRQRFQQPPERMILNGTLGDGSNGHTDFGFDLPGIKLGNDWRYISVSYDFSSFVMWKAPVVDSIYVSVKQYDWNFWGEASSNDGITWNLGDHGGTENMTLNGVETDQLPEYDYHVNYLIQLGPNQMFIEDLWEFDD